MAKSFTEESSQSEKKAKNLTSYIREFQSRDDFKKYLIISLLLLIVFETIVGLGFNKYFSETLEENKKKHYTRAWNNYLLQKWKADYSKITGYVWWNDVWKKLYAGHIQQLQLAFNADTTIRESYDLFSIYLKAESEPVFTILGKDRKEPILPSKDLIKKLYELQNGKIGSIHSIVKLQDDKLFLISVSALCDDLGKPTFQGITIFASELDKFLRLAEEVIPVTMKVNAGKPPEDIYHHFLIPNQFSSEDQFYIEVKPEYEIQTLVLKTLLFFITIQILLTLSLLILIVPRYTKRKTKKLEEIIKASEQLNIELTNKINELKIAKEETEKSETKYRHLVESSKDIIFSFDNNGFILTANKALVEFLGFKQDDLIGKYFLDLAYNAEKKVDSLEKQLLMEKFEELKENQESVSFDMTFGTKNNEPLQLGVKWEYVKIRDNFVVFGKAFTVSEDSMLKYFESENRKYVFNNYITLAEQVSQRITSNLVKYIDAADAFNVRICVREIIINSIEHGNLNIDYETKTELRKTKGGYFKFLQERQNDPMYKNRRVTVWYSLKADRVSFLVKDEGKGFDHQKLLADNSENANKNFLDHGRGIFMTKNTFDRIKYNHLGNKVLLIKYFK
ncbi:MAG: ATP-binding protein [Leptospiraceae bacterium]|nr:ATP-binding protein [Leptospiraceae bacterium]